MRVVTGIARGRKLVAPAGTEVRPTTDMTKEAIFNILQNDIPNSKVLDLFAGSGQLGIEALSRGAKHATFIDANKQAIAFIKENLQRTDFTAQSSVSFTDAPAFLKGCTCKFDIVLLDPPYGKNIIDKVLPEVLELMEPKGVVVCETQRNEALPEGNDRFKVYKEYFYGKVKLTVYRDVE
ncbi:MAG: 16S rRNA (guanine(966)-N(2))-methyltransferase RsmD [Oscillospiraceae bacterium]